MDTPNNSNLESDTNQAWSTINSSESSLRHSIPASGLTIDPTELSKATPVLRSVSPTQQDLNTYRTSVSASQQRLFSGGSYTSNEPTISSFPSNNIFDHHIPEDASVGINRTTQKTKSLDAIRNVRGLTSTQTSNSTTGIPHVDVHPACNNDTTKPHNADVAVAPNKTLQCVSCHKHKSSSEFVALNGEEHVKYVENCICCRCERKLKRMVEKADNELSEGSLRPGFILTDVESVASKHVQKWIATVSKKEGIPLLSETEIRELEEWAAKRGKEEVALLQRKFPLRDSQAAEPDNQPIRIPSSTPSENTPNVRKRTIESIVTYDSEERQPPNPSKDCVRSPKRPKITEGPDSKANIMNRDPNDVVPLGPISNESQSSLPNKLEQEFDFLLQKIKAFHSDVEEARLLKRKRQAEFLEMLADFKDKLVKVQPVYGRWIEQRKESDKEEELLTTAWR